MEMMSKLNLGSGDEPAPKARSTANDKDTNPEKAEKFRQELEKAKTDRSAEKEQIRKMGDALDKAGVPLPKKDTFPKTTAAFEAIAKSDAERAERKAAKASGGGGGIPKLNRDLTRNYKAGGSVSSASKRADGCATKGKTRGKMI